MDFVKKDIKDQENNHKIYPNINKPEKGSQD